MNTEHGKHFYSHAPCGARLSFLSSQKPYVHFYSHAPCGARPIAIIICGIAAIFLLTRPLRGATERWRHNKCSRRISTHTPLAGRDGSSLIFSIRLTISTHTPLAGRDCTTLSNRKWICYFYSHAPCGARHQGSRMHHLLYDFYSHAPCGARQN